MKLLLSSVLLITSININAYQVQLMSNWCWASAIQNVLGQVGIYEQQVNIAARLDGLPRNRPAGLHEVKRLINSYGIPAVWAGRSATAEELFFSLNNGKRVIALVRPSRGPVGHFVVLQSITRQGVVTVFDPGTGATTYQHINQLYQMRWQDAVVVG
jgi:hypothetical protein